MVDYGRFIRNWLRFAFFPLAAESSFDPEMRLEDGIVIFGGDALAGNLSEPDGLLGKGLLDAEPAGQDVAMESKSIGVGSALVGTGHDQFSVVTFREITTHYLHLNLSRD